MAASYTRRINLYINGKIVRNDIRSIRDEMIKMERNIKTLERGSREYYREMSRIKHLKGILAEHNAQLQVTQVNLTSLKGVANAFNKFMPMVMGFIGTFVGLSMSVNRVVSDFAQFDDKIADVMKVTGMTREQVVALNEELKKIDTRTAQETLLELAWVAGKLGINAADDVIGFVNAADKITVALAKDLGGNAEEAIRAIGKAVEIFDLEEIYGIEDAMIRVGSAINELGMASVAQEGFLVKFVERVAGVAPVTGVSIQNILGLAATLDIFGQKSEVSATAYSKLMQAMYRETATMAKLAGMSIKDWTDLLAKDANEAMLQLFETIKGDGILSFNALINALGDVGLDAQRMTQVMGTMINQVDTLREQQQLSNKAFEEGTSVVNEFNIKNNNAQAIIEKKQRQLKILRIELGERLLPVYVEGMNVFEGFLRTMTTFIEFIYRNGRAIMALTAAMVAYRVVLKTTLALKQMHIVTSGLLQWAVLRLKVAYLALTGQMFAAGRAAVALRSINLTNPWLLLASAIAAVVAGLLIYARTKKEVSIAEKSAADIQKRTTEEYARQTANVHRLRSAVNNETLALDARKSALDELRKIIPDYHAELDNEGKLINNNIKAIEDWIEATKKEIRLRVYKDQWEELFLQQESTSDLINEARKKHEAAVADYNDKMGFHWGPYGQMNRHRDEARYQRDLAKKELDRLLALYDEYTKEMGIIEGKIAGIVTKPPVLGPSREDWEKFQKQLKLGFEERINYSKEAEQKELIALNQRRLKQLISEEDFQKKLIEIEDRYRRGRLYQDTEPLDPEYDKQLLEYQNFRLGILREEDKYLQSLVEIGAELDPVEKEKQAYIKRLREAKLFGKDAAKLTKEQQAAFEVLELQHQQKLAEIHTTFTKDKLDDLKKEFEDNLKDLVWRNDQEYQAIETKEQAIKLLQDKYRLEDIEHIKTFDDAKKEVRRQQQADEIRLAKIFWNDLLGILENRLQSLNQLSLEADNIIDEEQRKIIQDRIREIREEIIALNKELESLTGDGDSKTQTTKAPRHSLLGVDIFGFRPDDWAKFFDRTDKTLDVIDRIGMALYAMGNIWSDVNKLIAAQENQALQRFEQNQDRRRRELDHQLEHKLISYEDYEERIRKIDLETDRERAKVARKQAIRARNLAIFEALVNTAVAITKTLAELGPIAGPIMAILIGALGAVQVGAIASQPLPQIPAYERGGFIDVLRQQDKKKFRAKNDPNKRGFINRPTILAGEKPEYVLPYEALQNPSIRQFVDFIEMQRINNNLSRVDMRAAMPQVVGRQSGGFTYFAEPGTRNLKPETRNPEPETRNTELETNKKLLAVIEKLNQNIENGIQSKLVYQELKKFLDKVTTSESQQL